jgi:hypothetical protein
MTWLVSGEDGVKYLFLGKKEMQHLLAIVVALHTLPKRVNVAFPPCQEIKRYIHSSKH